MRLLKSAVAENERNRESEVYPECDQLLLNVGGNIKERVWRRIVKLDGYLLVSDAEGKCKLHKGGLIV